MQVGRRGLERRDRGLGRPGGEVHVPLGGRERLVAYQLLNDAGADAPHGQVTAEGVAQLVGALAAQLGVRCLRRLGPRSSFLCCGSARGW